MIKSDILANFAVAVWEKLDRHKRENLKRRGTRFAGSLTSGMNAVLSFSSHMKMSIKMLATRNS